MTTTDRDGYTAGPLVTLQMYTGNGRKGWEQRFWRKVHKTDSCWLWTGGQSGSGSGYGQMTIGGHRRLTHRLSWLIARGPIPRGMHLDHLCRVQACCNPDHLDVVTSRENTMRGASHVVGLAEATSCTNGHLFTTENTYWWRQHRQCRECNRNYCRDYQRRVRAGLVGAR